MGACRVHGVAAADWRVTDHLARATGNAFTVLRGRTRARDVKVFSAVIAIAARKNSTQIIGAHRILALESGTDPHTIRNTMPGLIRLDLLRWGARTRDRARILKVTAQPDAEQADELAHTDCSVFYDCEAGAAGCLVWHHLDRAPSSALVLAAMTGLHRNTISRTMPLLAAHGLADRRAGGWVLGAVWPNAVTTVADHRGKAASRYQADRGRPFA